MSNGRPNGYIININQAKVSKDLRFGELSHGIVKFARRNRPSSNFTHTNVRMIIDVVLGQTNSSPSSESRATRCVGAVYAFPET